MKWEKVNIGWIKIEFYSVLTSTAACIFSAYQFLVGQADSFVVDYLQFVQVLSMLI